MAQRCRFINLLLLLTLFAHLAGCARSVATIGTAHRAFATGDLDAASLALEEIANESPQMKDTASLDMAIVELAAGKTSAAERRLRALRDHFDTVPKTKPIHELASVATDENARPFYPAGYEEVMLRTMLAFCSLAGDQVDAESYTLQAITRQTELARQADQQGLNGTNLYQPIAIAPYLRGVLREATHHDYDDASRYYQLVSSVRPEFSAAANDIIRSQNGTHSQHGNGVLYVISCVGRGPVLRETVAPTTTAALAIASSVLNTATNQKSKESSPSTSRADGTTADAIDEEVPALPNIASVKVPEVFIPASPIARLGIAVNGKIAGTTETVTDIGELAIRQNTAEMPWTIARAIVRRVAKETTVASITDAIGLEGTAGSMFHFATASAWSGLEKADLRCWGLLPREIQVLRTELPAGDHEIHVLPLNSASDTISTGKRVTVSINNGRNHYLIVMAPTERMHLIQQTTKN